MSYNVEAILSNLGGLWIGLYIETVEAILSVCMYTTLGLPPPFL